MTQKELPQESKNDPEKRTNLEKVNKNNPVYLETPSALGASTDIVVYLLIKIIETATLDGGPDDEHRLGPKEGMAFCASAIEGTNATPPLTHDFPPIPEKTENSITKTHKQTPTIPCANSSGKLAKPRHKEEPGSATC